MGSGNLSSTVKKSGIITIQISGSTNQPKEKDITKHRFNASQFMQYSNATPIRYQGSIGFLCCFCNRQYPDPADLKYHSINEHDDDSKFSFLSNKRMCSYIVKMDITNLQCKICAKDMGDLDDLAKHLISAHDKKIYTDIKSFILPLKFGKENLSCYICLQMFNRLKGLQEHMNVHMRNFVCEECDAGFLNQMMLKNHSANHEIGSFKCGFCDNVYVSMKSKKLHERNVHTRSKLIYKCGGCGEMFHSNESKKIHLRKVHNVVSKSLKCAACEKLFQSQKSLRIHVQRDHLVERNFECSMCDMKFFEKQEMILHMVKHSGEKLFQCDVCKKSYGRKKTLREHIRSPDNTDSRESDNVSGSWNKTGAITINLRGDAQVRDITKHRHNARQFIQLSNATPIRYQASMGFVCCFCYEQFHDPADLKSHTMNDHDDKCKLKFMSGKSISTYIVKMDITNLQCKLCAENLIDIDALTKHLITVHNKKVYTDVKSYIVPFKFETEDLRCCMCSQVFSRLKALQEHMNVHMRNYTCEICDAGFLNQKMLKNHMEGHESGSFKCDFCENVYASMKIKKLHERNVHTRPKLINKCGACYEMFTSYRAKERHLRTAHGIINNRLKCSACEKLFPNPNALRVHIKRDHLLERRYKCTMCDMGFFLKSELNGHLVKHSGDKSYQCEICNRSKVKKDACKDTEVHAIEDFVTVPQKKNTQNRELYKHIYNVEQVLKWSNATAFKSFGRIGYTCCYCGMEFPDPAVLKKHNLDLHRDGVKTASFAQRRDLCAFNVKLDITDLRCKICEVAIDNIDKLLIHLRSAHQLKLYTEILNHMIPFKFDGDILSCFICQNKFNRFKNLLEHMSVHCRNFICETCDAGFVNKRRLLCHSNQHKLGEFKCSLCVKVFNTLQKKQSHEKNVHLTKGYLNRCGYCNEVFKSYRQKERHLVRVHEYKYTALKCDTCNKQFTHQKAYYIHITRDHLMQRNHECNFCEMKFYSWSELKDHSVKHTKVREFQCDVCLKSFGRRDALKQHLRIHANDRRYKCVRCDQTFIQKCSWRSHMKTKHGETV
ncbi:unnamed protein product [Leptidea sinapis]|uniref:C2H2-type domain-containing protein n=1 Tax=Leptidea sinapis TaxID=189913 RepID=A0A5E4QK85_9NEOP|nr:unnamed protein product [Leptidea sinapis]